MRHHGVQIAWRMLADLNQETTDPDSDLPATLTYGFQVDPGTHRVRISVFGCRDVEIYTGPGHVDSVVPDLPEILAAFASCYGGEEDPDVPGACFQVLVHVYDEHEQASHADERNTVLIIDLSDDALAAASPGTG